MSAIPPWLLVAFYWLHMLATVAWIGGLASLAWLVLPAARRVLSQDAYSGFIQLLSRRIQLVGWLSLAVLVVTGMFQMSASSSYQGFLAVTSPWAAAILLKHVAIGIMVLLSALVTWGITPRLERLALLRARGKGDAAELQRLHHREEILLRANLVCSALVLLLTAWARSTG